jgi:hypothetical protein
MPDETPLSASPDDRLASSLRLEESLRREDEDRRVYYKLSEARYYRWETYFWYFVLPTIITAIVLGFSHYEDLRSFVSYNLPRVVLIWFGTLTTPLLFRMTFATLPFAALRRVAANRAYAALGAEKVSEDAFHQHVSDPRELLYRFARESGELAQRIYTRAGVYLIVGVFIAIGGLGFFYFRTPSVSEQQTVVERALSLLPGFGILFFIEFVALFFLRQHRAAMDDFRYYDAVRRRREENLVILQMFAENNMIAATTDVIKAMTIYSGPEKLIEGETTEMLEARRLQRDELVIFEKLIEALSAAKETVREPKTKVGLTGALRRSRK